MKFKLDEETATLKDLEGAGVYVGSTFKCKPFDDTDDEFDCRVVGFRVGWGCPGYRNPVTPKTLAKDVWTCWATLTQLDPKNVFDDPEITQQYGNSFESLDMFDFLEGITSIK